MKGIDYLAQDRPPIFEPKDIPVFRRKIVYEIYRGLKLTIEDE